MVIIGCCRDVEKISAIPRLYLVYFMHILIVAFLENCLKCFISCPLKWIVRGGLLGGVRNNFGVPKTCIWLPLRENSFYIFLVNSCSFYKINQALEVYCRD